ncbi:cytochrome P450 [Corynascus novoguineensis]|uniref:Cytochrome P450 n=1 Tax=Corynascus novoguineensis TaxID=1126955 RepID=A0AAN7HLD2_9PEZI|nr:cytochrome P450 [Corynascus novoguineensis]
MGLLVEYGHYILTATVLAVLVHAVSANRKSIRRNGEPLRNPPDTLPLVGNGLKFLQSRWELFSWFDKCQRQFGYETVALRVPTLPPGVLIHDPRNLDFVFKNEGLFTKGDFVKQRSWALFGNGIINADGDFWKLQRKAGSAFLNTANLRVLTEVALPQYLSETVEYLQQNVDKGTVDLQHVFHEITTKLMGKMAYNMEMHADDEFSKCFDYASGATAERFQNPLWRITELFTGSKLRKSIRVIKDFGRRIVTSAVHDRNEQKSKREPDGPSDESSKLDQISGSLIQSLLEAIGNEETVADAALTYLSAGRDTTGQALTWTLYLLLQHPSAVARIRQEVQDLLQSQQQLHPQDSPSHPTTTKPPTTKETTKPFPLGIDPTLLTPAALPYTTAVFHEALRLFPPIPFEIRQTQADTTLPDGTFLPRYSVLVWCLWAMQRSRLTWGADADEFRPERFLVPASREEGEGKGGQEGEEEQEEGKGMKTPRAVRFALGKTSAEFPVFYGGARACLGRKMAEAIAVQVIPTVLVATGVRLEGAWEGGRRSQTSLTLPMEGGLPVLVKK